MGDRTLSVTLGIDIGTSGTKTLAVRENGEILGSASADYPCSYPKPGWSEQAPELWWQATCKTIRETIAQAGVKPSEVLGIGLSGQMHGSVLLDADGEVVRPALLWNDQRTADECLEIESKAGGRESLVKMVANRALTGFTAPKLLWVRHHEPTLWERVCKVLLPKDYVRYRLSGTFATEVSDASGTLLLDVGRRTWSDPLLQALDLDRALLPDCFESPLVSARVSSLGAEATGLPIGTPIVGGGGDQPAGAVGNGIVRPGAVSATLGTSGVVFSHTDQVGFDPEGRLQRGCHAVPGAWHVMGVVLAAAGSLQWYRENIAIAESAEAEAKGIDPYFQLTREAETIPRGSEGLFFLPYLTGERTPHFDPNARGGWIGLTVRHRRGHLVRAVMEGAAFAMRDSLELIREMGAPISEIRLSGGGAKNPLWRQLQSDIYGQETSAINASEGPAFGVALLALVGVGRYNTVPEACDATIKVVERYPEDMNGVEFYNRAHSVYRRLYSDLKDRFVELSALDS